MLLGQKKKKLLIQAMYLFFKITFQKYEKKHT